MIEQTKDMLLALPPVPTHPEPRSFRWSRLEEEVILEYGRSCALAVLGHALSHPKSNLADSGVIAAPRGTDAQILKERELTASAISGAIAYGQQGWEYPPDDSAWLRPFYGIGKQLAAAPVDHVPEAGKMVAGVHPAKGTSALAAPVVPAPVAKPRLIGWRTSDFLMETADKAMAQNWEVHHEMLPIFEGDSYTSLQAAPVAQLSEPPASAALMRILKIVQDYVPPDGTPIEEAMSQIIACVDPWPDTGFNQFDDLLDDAAEWSGYVEVDTAPYGLKRHLKEVFEKYGITAAAPTTPKDAS